ncbi:uncharacterized protein K452DRAFT_269252 [Aplosporella prunicola CBS 121167]|uniref:Uncharacterized protein n=1 Tax=Aplosporella prunicola CBS 121167 TaxID=1176127 RepID=A0A6A6BF50_9PEZI|nr:uncharacterized protein K452DRAFT_269252 [Aplosporella prunicola CBS 121167]KAF2142792.1 hypothetical protein K452DRAFT_269252 [Aplosporella prunicola CBS 121167]
MSSTAVDTAPAVARHDNSSTTSSLPRQRLPVRSQTWEPSQQQQPVRRSSIFSDFSFDDTKRSVRSSTDNLRDMDIEPTNWHSVPLAFAILPAVAGIFFNNGNAVVTDMLLLGLATMLLNWCIRKPWEWYNSLQVPTSAEPPPPVGLDFSGTIPEEEAEGEEALGKPAAADAQTAREEFNDEEQQPGVPDHPPEYPRALSELRQDEQLALACCFLAPIAGAYLLHAIRGVLSRPTEGLVSNYNLSIFLLAAEMRPVSHLFNMQIARAKHLQRVVTEYSRPESGKLNSEIVQDLQTRISELEAHIANAASTSASGKNDKVNNASPAEVANTVRQSFQPQLDALTRAVRRYEKRVTTQTMVTEGRLQGLESRLNDAFTLAAAAAQNKQQKSSVVALLLDAISTLFMLPLQAVWITFVYPFNVIMGGFGGMKVWLFGPDRKPERKGKSRAKGSYGHASSGGYKSPPGSAKRS